MKPITRLKTGMTVSYTFSLVFFGHSEQFLSLQYSYIVTGSTVSGGGIIDKEENGLHFG